MGAILSIFNSYMKRFVLILFLFTCCFSCAPDKLHTLPEQGNSEMRFDQEKWKVKDGEDFPFRAEMVKELLYNDSIRNLGRNEILQLLGAPSRINEDYWYYMISQKRIASWPIHTRTLVIKFMGDDSMEWMKIHE